MIDIEHGHRRRVFQGRSRAQHFVEAPAKQGAFGESGQWIVVREIFYGVGVLQGAHGEGQRGSDILQQQQFIVAHKGCVAGHERKRADRHPVHHEGQRHHRSYSGRKQLLAPPDRQRFAAREIPAGADVAGAHGAPRQAGIRFLAVADIQIFGQNAFHALSGNKPRPRPARALFHHPYHRRGVEANLRGNPAGLLQQQLTIANAKHRGTDGALHLENARQLRDIRLMALALAPRAQGGDPEGQIRGEFVEQARFPQGRMPPAGRCRPRAHRGSDHR